MKKENTTVSTGIQGQYKIKPDGKAMGHDYFDCSSDTFNRCIQGREKGKHWSTFISDNQLSTKIKEYMKANKGKQFMLRDSTSGAFIFADKRFKY